MAGRAGIGMGEYRQLSLARWADEGEKFLRDSIPAKDLEYSTSWSVVELTITLTVFRRLGVGPVQEIFKVTEPAGRFVSHLTVTKILMIS